MEKFFLEQNNTALLIIDVQERLAKVMEVKEKVIANCVHLVEIAKTYDMPVLVTEQYPRGLGPTVEEIRNAVPEYRPVEKLTFSCCDEQSFLEELRRLNRKYIILAGMETHVCVLQTGISLLRKGFQVHLVKDAVCSRAKENWDTGIGFMRDAGAVITCTETVLFQILKIAGTEEFKALSRRIK